jgi:four helix bundle protein
MSIGANLAEGCGRRTSAELARFVRIAMGSASELDYHLLLCRDFEFLAKEDYARLFQELTRVRKMLWSLLMSIEEQIDAGGVAVTKYRIPSTKS